MTDMTPTLDELRERFQSFVLGFAQHRSEGVTLLLALDWEQAAAAEQRRRATRLVEVFDDDLLASIASGVLRPAIEAMSIKAKLIEAERETDSAPSASVIATVAPEAASPPRIVVAMRETVEALALKHFGMQTLETRKRDSLDFHSVAVWSVREALSSAFCEGVASARGDTSAPAHPSSARNS